MESITDAFFALDEEWRFTYLNSEAERLLFRTREKLLGRNIWEEFPEAVGSTFYREYHKAASERVTVEFEEYYPPLKTWFEVKAYPAQTGLSVFFRNVNERRKAEEALRESEARYARITANAPGMVYQFVLRPDGSVGFPFVSEGSRELYELEPREIQQDPTLVIDIVHPEDRPGFDRSVEASAAALSPWKWEGRVTLRSGEQKWLRGSARPERQDNGNILWDGLLMDITVYKRGRQAALHADVGAALARGGTLPSILQGCAEAMVRHFDAAFARIWLLDKEENVLELQASAGMYTHLDGPHSRVPFGQFKVGLIAQERRPHLTNKVSGDSRVSDKEWAKREGMTSFAGYPLIVEDRLVGVMAMFAREPLAEDAIEALASVADTVAQGVERKRAEEALQRSESILAAAQQIAHVGSWEYDVDEDKTRWSDEVYRIFGFSPGQFVPTRTKHLESVHSEDRESVAKLMRDPNRGKEHTSSEYRIVRPDGAVRTVQNHREVIFDETDRLVRITGTVQDVTERKRSEEALRLRDQAIAASSDGIIITDPNQPDNPMVYVNRGFERISGYTAKELVGRNCRFLQGQDRDQPALARLRAAIGAGRGWTGVLRNYRKDGTLFWNEISISPVRDEDGRLSSFVGVMNDVTERKALEERLEYQAHHDPLTNLPNRALFMDRFGQALARVQRHEGKVAVLFMDLDGFKPINDSLGHEAGDRLLIEVAERLKSCLRPEDTAARLGGDEFTVLLEDVEEAGDAIRVAERIVAELQTPFALDGREVSISTSIGIALSGPDQSRPEDLLREADSAMYRAKERGETHYEIVRPGSRAPETKAQSPAAPGGDTPPPANMQIENRFARDQQPELTITRYTSEMPKKANGEHRRAEQELYLRDRAIAASSNGIVISDPNQPDNPLIYVNRSFELMTGYSAEELLGHNCRFLQGSGGDQPALDEVRAAVREERDCEVLLRNYRKDGTLFWNELRLSPVHDEQGQLVNFIGVQNDVTERKQAEEDLQRAHDELEDRVRQRTARLTQTNAQLHREIAERRELEEQLTHQAFHDPLTGLPNRTLFLDRLDLALARTEQRGGKVAVLFMDLDNFKVINDSLGHEVGDQVLLAVAERLENSLSAEETVARFGGDEFTVLLEDIASVSDAARVAERIEEALRAPFYLGGRERFITTSIGIVLSTSGGELPEVLLRYADAAMYQAKSAGRARYAVFDPSMTAAALERLELESDLRRALEREEFRVHYQPKVSLGSGEIIAMEALLRWEHPERGLVSPAQFIPVAEETDLIVPIGRWVLEEACRQARRWRDQFPDRSPLKVCVNLSARQFQYHALVEDVAAILRESGLDPASLDLEITESVVMEDAPSTLVTLQKLKDLGVNLAIDDFGTGYSSLSYLRRFPVDFLKIDRSITQGLGEDPKNEAIVSAVVTLAHALDETVIAEGVETEGQLARLREIGCDFAQGYYFAKPLPGEEADLLVELGLNR